MDNSRRFGLDGWAAAVLALIAVGGGCSTSASKVGTDEHLVVSHHTLLSMDVPGDVGGNEPALAVSPLDASIIALAGCSEVSLSFDGGQSFPTNVPFVTPPGYGGGVCDAVVAFDSGGRLFVTFPAFFNSPGAETDSLRPTARPAPAGTGGLLSSPRRLGKRVRPARRQPRPVPNRRNQASRSAIVPQRRARAVGRQALARCRRTARVRCTGATARDAHLHDLPRYTVRVLARLAVLSARPAAVLG